MWFCVRCGMYSKHRADKLRYACRGFPLCASKARLRRLLRGLHPVTGKRLAGEQRWLKAAMRVALAGPTHLWGLRGKSAARVPVVAAADAADTASAAAAALPCVDEAGVASSSSGAA